MRTQFRTARILPASVTLSVTLSVALSLAIIVGLPGGAADAAPRQVGGVQLIEAWPDVEFKEPIHVTHAGDGSDYLYVAEQPGVVKRIKKYRGVGDVPQPKVFLDIRGR